MAVITHYKTFEVNGSSNIPNCETNIGAKISIDGAFENYGSALVNMDHIDFVINKKDSNGTYQPYGYFYYDTLRAIKPNTMYNIKCPSFTAETGSYSIENLYVVESNQTAGYYLSSPVSMKWLKF